MIKVFRCRNKENFVALGLGQGRDANFHTHEVMKADLSVTVFYEVTAPQPCSTDVHIQLYFLLLRVLFVHLSPIHTFPAQVGARWEQSRDLAGQGYIGSSGEWPSRVSWDCKDEKKTCEWGDGRMGPAMLLWFASFCSSSSSWPTSFPLTFHHHQLYLVLCISSLVFQLALVLARMVEMDFGELHFYGTFTFSFRYLKQEVAAFFGLIQLSLCCGIEIKQFMSICTFLLFPIQLSCETFFPFYLLGVQMPWQDDSAINSCILSFQVWILKTWI